MLISDRQADGNWKGKFWVWPLCCRSRWSWKQAAVTAEEEGVAQKPPTQTRKIWFHKDSSVTLSSGRGNLWSHKTFPSLLCGLFLSSEQQPGKAMGRENSLCSGSHGLGLVFMLLLSWRSQSCYRPNPNPPAFTSKLQERQPHCLLSASQMVTSTPHWTSQLSAALLPQQASELDPQLFQIPSALGKDIIVLGDLWKLKNPKWWLQHLGTRTTLR